jgi:glycosyltransferase involved in cell wall biosynthesis
MRPHVTVLMSVYNSEEYLAEAIDSILQQTFSDFEFLIINDGSTDSTRAILQDYPDRRIRCIDNEANMGLSASLNRGLALAEGAYIVRMDADDIALPNRIHTQVSFMEQAQTVDVCGSWYEMFGDKAKVVKTLVEHQAIKDTLFFKNCIAHSTVCIKRKSLEACGGCYDESYAYAQDYELWCRLVDSATFANIPEVLLKYRMHGSQAGNCHMYKQDACADRVRKRNLQAIGLQLCTEEEKIYFDMVTERFEPKNKNEVRLAAMVLEKIYRTGKSLYGEMFRERIRRFMKPLPEASIDLGAASIELFGVFSRAGFLSNNRDKIRYLYNGFKNMAGIK